jgi:hypothetical protein
MPVEIEAATPPHALHVGSPMMRSENSSQKRYRRGLRPSQRKNANDHLCCTTSRYQCREQEQDPHGRLSESLYACDIFSTSVLGLFGTVRYIEKILNAMHLPADVPELHPARPPPGSDREAGDGEHYLN